MEWHVGKSMPNSICESLGKSEIFPITLWLKRLPVSMYQINKVKTSILKWGRSFSLKQHHKCYVTLQDNYYDISFFSFKTLPVHFSYNL